MIAERIGLLGVAGMVLALSAPAQSQDGLSRDWSLFYAAGPTTEITTQAQRTVTQIVKSATTYLRAGTLHKIVIQACSDASVADPVAFTQRRAEAMVDELAKSGLPKSLMQPVALGSSEACEQGMPSDRAFRSAWLRRTEVILQ